MKGNYLLTTPMARRLYEEVAAELPLIDYHNHLNVSDIASAHRFDDVAELWLLSDPYKHRAMRICGVDEYYITGGADRFEKFSAWCRVYPQLMGGPLYDWSRFELEEFFGITDEICEENAERIWNKANAVIAGEDFNALTLLNHFKVEYAAPCASVADDLSPFEGIDNLAPSLRGDDMLTPNAALAERLSKAAGVPVTDDASLREAIRLRLDGMDAVGCRFADLALDNGFRYTANDRKNAERIAAMLAGQEPDAESKNAVFSGMLRFLGTECARRGWVLQLHVGAERFTSTRLRRATGGAGGFAGIGSCVDVRSLVSLLDDIEQSEYGLPKIILYTLNPSDNAVMSILSGSFPGVTQGPAWWWCDHLQGMREMLDVFSSFSVLSSFVGMTTDSRSLLSLLRHDYFRRCFCGWVGEKAERNELPDDFDTLSGLVRRVCYENAKNIMKEGKRNV